MLAADPYGTNICSLWPLLIRRRRSATMHDTPSGSGSLSSHPYCVHGSWIQLPTAVTRRRARVRWPARPSLRWPTNPRPKFQGTTSADGVQPMRIGAGSRHNGTSCRRRWASHSYPPRPPWSAACGLVSRHGISKHRTSLAKWRCVPSRPAQASHGAYRAKRGVRRRRRPVHLGPPTSPQRKRMSPSLCVRAVRSISAACAKSRSTMSTKHARAAENGSVYLLRRLYWSGKARNPSCKRL